MSFKAAGILRELKPDAIDAEGGVRQHDCGAALFRRKAGEGAEAPGAAVVPHDRLPADVVRMSQQSPTWIRAASLA